MKDEMIKWYNDALEQYGEGDFRSITWADAEGKSALKRYQQMDSVCSFADKTIIEVGCAWGSFFDFGFTAKRYMGCDINEKLIELAAKKYPQHNFFVHDISNDIPPVSSELVICTGVAGNQGGPADHPHKISKFLDNLLKLGNTVLVNFPSTHSTIRAKNIEYFSPGDVLTLALQVSPNVTLYHQNMADFLIKIEK